MELSYKENQTQNIVKCNIKQYFLHFQYDNSIFFIIHYIFLSDFHLINYIMPPIPPPAGIGGISSLIVPTTDSVVRSVEATLVAF